jgi:hypothetical protein
MRCENVWECSPASSVESVAGEEYATWIGRFDGTDGERHRRDSNKLHFVGRDRRAVNSRATKLFALFDSLSTSWEWHGRHTINSVD